MKPSKRLLILILAAAFGMLGGCSLLPTRPVRVGPGEIVEIAEPRDFYGWVKNAETGKNELRRVEAEAGWYVGRPAYPE